ncbi:hypothetical protein SAMN04487785_11529 [Dyella jiangningensis]|nr:hypothetical protein BDW41_105119 [Dyella sp. AtDHG13]SDL13342.1 hypothetical protein SAMN04487785_11529 [Dyella jiangningensis]
MAGRVPALHDAPARDRGKALHDAWHAPAGMALRVLAGTWPLAVSSGKSHATRLAPRYRVNVREKSFTSGQVPRASLRAADARRHKPTHRGACAHSCGLMTALVARRRACLRSRRGALVSLSRRWPVATLVRRWAIALGRSIALRRARILAGRTCAGIRPGPWAMVRWRARTLRRWRTTALRRTVPATRWRPVTRRRWPCARTPARRTRRRTWRKRTAIPVIAIPVERPVHVVRAPVRRNGKRDDGNADAGAIVGHVYRLVLIGVLHERARHPATHAHGDHVAPRPARRAALDGDAGACGQLRDGGIAWVGPA